MFSESPIEKIKYPEWLIEHVEKILIMMNFRINKNIQNLAIVILNDLNNRIESFGGIITWHKEKCIPVQPEKWMKESFPRLWEEYLKIKNKVK